MVNKQEIINNALSKLTDEEKLALGLVKKENKPKVKTKHKLTIYYGVGSSSQTVEESGIFDINNPFVKPLVEALDKLQERKGSWAISLKENQYKDNLERGLINQFEHDLLLGLSWCEFREDDTCKEFLEMYNYEYTKENKSYLNDLGDLIMNENEYTFLIYLGYKLK